MFFPYTADGAALMFEAVDLEDDGAAMGHAERLLSQHASAAEVVIWEDDREVHREVRTKGTTRELCDDPSGAVDLA